MTLLQKLRFSGINFANSPSERRSILLSNVLSLIIFCVGISLFITFFLWYGLGLIALSIIIVSFLSLLPIVFNLTNHTVIGRLWLCLLIPVSAIFVSIYSKSFNYESQQSFDYINYRFVILASCVFPAIFFTFKEKKLLLSASLSGFCALMLHDPLHTFFGVPYLKNGLNISDYYFTNVIIFVTYAVMVGAVTFLKKISDESEACAEDLIRKLNQRNNQLYEKSTEIEAQNHEILSQADNLSTSQQKLQEAYLIIEEQKEKLLLLNKHLSNELIETNKELSNTNNELIKHNNELRQFSYTVSHNLRGPVASLSGLINLMNLEDLNAENTEIYTHTKKSIESLELVIKDLNQIIDIRNDLYQIRKRIDLVSICNEIFHGFKKEIEYHNIIIKVDCDNCAEVYSVRPMVYSILYNLISNAIKYRAPERRSEIIVAARMDQGLITIEVTDNGLGIDLKNHKDNLFKLYKRFHFHTEGTGLGLYLVKLQAEALGGWIEVISEINKFTKFIVQIGKPENIEHQILYQSSFAKIFYDARINSTGVIWHGPVSSEQYRGVFTKCLEFVKAYNTPNYMADLSDQGYITREDQAWMFHQIMPEAARYGLKKIAAIRPDKDDPKLKEYFKGISHHLVNLGVEQKFFHSFDEATQWIQYQNEMASLIV